MINYTVFGKTMENVRKQRCQFATNATRRKYLVSEPNYHTRSVFSEYLLVIGMKKQIQL